MGEELIKTDELETKPFNKFIDDITGLALSDKKDHAHAANRLFKSIFAKEFITQLQMEWDILCQKGHIDTDYIGSKPYMNTFAELLDYLDNDIPNDEIAQTLKKLFLLPAFKNSRNGDEFLSYEYMRIIRGLNAGELSVLFAAYKISAYQKEKGINDQAVKIWRECIAKETKLRFVNLVLNHESKLIDLKLLQLHNDYNNMLYSGNTEFSLNRLTDLGYALCDYINMYDSDAK